MITAPTILSRVTDIKDLDIWDFSGQLIQSRLDLVQLELMAELKVLSNGTEGGSKVVSFDPS